MKTAPLVVMSFKVLGSTFSRSIIPVWLWSRPSAAIIVIEDVERILTFSDDALFFCRPVLHTDSFNFDSKRENDLKEAGTMTDHKDTAAPLQRIILAIDASEASAKALEFVRVKFRVTPSSSEAGQVPIHVTVVHVLARRHLAPIEFRFTAPWIKSENKVKDAASRLVKNTAQQLIKEGFEAEHLYKIGDPAEEILKVAAKRKADLIVMGAKGLGTIDRVLLGSVSMQVLQYAHCPVLVVR